MSQSTLGRLDSRTTAPLAEIQPHRTRVTARAADQEQLAFLFASSSPNHDTGPLSGPQSTPVRATNSSAAVVGCTLRVEATVPSLPPIAQAVLLQFPELEAPTLSIFSITYSTEKGRRHAKSVVEQFRLALAGHMESIVAAATGRAAKLRAHAAFSDDANRTRQRTHLLLSLRKLDKSAVLREAEATVSHLQSAQQARAIVHYISARKRARGASMLRLATELAATERGSASVGRQRSGTISRSTLRSPPSSVPVSPKEARKEALSVTWESSSVDHPWPPDNTTSPPRPEATAHAQPVERPASRLGGPECHGAVLHNATYMARMSRRHETLQTVIAQHKPLPPPRGIVKPSFRRFRPPAPAHVHSAPQCSSTPAPLSLMTIASKRGLGSFKVSSVAQAALELGVSAGEAAVEPFDEGMHLVTATRWARPPEFVEEEEDWAVGDTLQAAMISTAAVPAPHDAPALRAWGEAELQLGPPSCVNGMLPEQLHQEVLELIEAAALHTPTCDLPAASELAFAVLASPAGVEAPRKRNGAGWSAPNVNADVDFASELDLRTICDPLAPDRYTSAAAAWLRRLRPPHVVRTDVRRYMLSVASGGALEMQGRLAQPQDWAQACVRRILACAEGMGTPHGWLVVLRTKYSMAHSFPHLERATEAWVLLAERVRSWQRAVQAMQLSPLHWRSMLASAKVAAAQCYIAAVLLYYRHHDVAFVGEQPVHEQMARWARRAMRSSMRDTGAA